MTAAAVADKIFRYKHLPQLVGRVLVKKGWRAAHEGEDWSLFWKNGRFTAAEFAEGTKEHHIFNHFYDTFHLTKKVRIFAFGE